MARHSRKRIAQRPSKDSPRFAPNFSVYVLPGDVVCLYSEDRKFFLHGELYCALAYAIGEGGRSLPQLVSELEHKFPADKITEALKRLLDRRFIVAKAHSSRDTVPAIWRSPALPPPVRGKISTKAPGASHPATGPRPKNPASPLGGRGGASWT